MESENGRFDVAEFAGELDGEPSTIVGTRLLLENARVKVWEIVLEPGQRAPFHRHVHAYFYVCARPGRVRVRFPNGYYVDGDAEEGEFAYMDHTGDQPGIHDLENIGDSTVCYTTVELL